MGALRGACLCGAVTYEVTGPLVDADHCHCSKCRRHHGAAFATYAGVEPGHFRWVRGQDLVRIYESAAGAGWCFCSVCGSSLGGSDQGEITSITLGTVEGDPGIRPASHIFVGSKACWYEISDELEQFDERGPQEPA